MKKIFLTVVVIGLSLIIAASANSGKETPTATGAADAFSDAKAISSSKFNPFSVAWTSTWTINEVKDDPISMSGSTGQAFALIDSFALGDAYSNAFAYSQGPNKAETYTLAKNFAFVTDFSAFATSQAYAEGTAY